MYKALIENGIVILYFITAKLIKSKCVAQGAKLISHLSTYLQ